MTDDPFSLAGRTACVTGASSGIGRSIATALVRAVTYENSDTVAPTPGPRTIDFSLSDGDGGTSNAETEIINVTPVNDAPTAAAG